MEEVWKEIDGFENLYLISNFGRIKGLTKNKILTPQLKRNHCIVILYNKDKKRIEIQLSRIVAKAFLKNDLNKNDYVIRKDNNVMNCNVNNLLVIPKKDFIQYSIFKYGYNKKLYFNYYGKKYTKKELLKIGNIKKTTFEERIKRGWNVYETVEIPIAKIKGVNC